MVKRERSVSIPRNDSEREKRNFGNEKYKANPILHTRHGVVYEQKLLMLYLWFGIQKQYSFKIATQFSEAGQFDDVYFEYIDKTTEDKVYQYLQAKHSQDEKRKIGINDLTSTNYKNDFCLQKYFTSYLEIRNKAEVKNRKLNFIIYTNIDLDKQLKEKNFEPLKDDYILLTPYEMNGVYIPQRFKDSFPEKKKIMDSLRTLGNKEIPDKYIEQFLKDLVWAVNQPDEKRLTAIIEREMKNNDIFTLINVSNYTKTVADKLQVRVSDWTITKDIGFLTYEDGINIFKEIEEDLAPILVEGSTTVYCDKLEKFGIDFEKKFEELDKFLNSECRIFNLITNESNMTLSSIKLYQILKTKELECIFMPLDHLISKKLNDIVIKALQSNKSFHLFIECSLFANETPQEAESLQTIINLITKTKIKVILVSQNNDIPKLLERDFRNIYEKKVGNCSLTDLTEDSRQELLSKSNFKLQGKNIDFCQLLNDDKSKHLAEHVNGKILDNLINNKEINISESPTDMEYEEIKETYYVERRFQCPRNDQQRDLTLKYFTKITDHVVIISSESGMGKSVVLSHLAVLIPNVWIIKSNLNHYCTAFREWSKNGNKEVKKKEALQLLYESLNFQIDTNYKAGKEKKKSEEKVKNFINNCLSIDNEGNAVFDFSTKRNKNDKEIWEESLMLEIELFTYLYNKDKVYLLFDWFDKIDPKYENEVAKLLTALTKSKIRNNIWITFRPYNFKKEMEEKLSACTYSLKPFIEKELTEFWMKKFKLDKQKEERTNLFITELLKEIFTFTDNQNKEFKSIAFIPLYTNIIADFFSKEFDTFILSSSNKIGIEKFKFLKLYEKFIKKKFKAAYPDTYREKKKSPTIYKKKLEKFRYHHEILAFEDLWEELISEKEKEEIKKLKDSIRTGEKKQYIGIIKMIDDKPVFIHGSFSAYLAAKYVWKQKLETFSMERFQTDFIQNIIIDRLIENNVIAITKFFKYIAIAYLRTVPRKSVYTTKELINLKKLESLLIELVKKTKYDESTNELLNCNEATKLLFGIFKSLANPPLVERLVKIIRDEKQYEKFLCICKCLKYENLGNAIRTPRINGQQ